MGKQGARSSNAKKKKEVCSDKSIWVPVVIIVLLFLYVTPLFLNFNVNKNEKLTSLEFGEPRVLSGDLPHYLVVASSIVKDGDFDLTNNYEDAENGNCDTGFNAKGKTIDHHSKLVVKESGEIFSRLDFFDYKGKIRAEKKGFVPEKYYEYSVHPPGLPFITALLSYPFLDPSNEKTSCTIEVIGVIFSLIVSLIGLFYFWLLLKHYDLKQSVVIGAFALLAFATPYWHYSKTYWAEVFITTLLIIALYELIARKRTLIAGIALAVGVTIKFPVIIFVGCIGLFFLYKKRWWNLLIFSIPIAFSVGLICLYHQYLFGSVFAVGQTYYFQFFGNPLVGYGGMLFSPSQGLLFFAPLICFAIGGIQHLKRKAPDDFVLYAGIILLYYSFWAIRGLAWEGGGYSNRYLLPLVPIMILFLAVWMNEDDFLSKKKLIRVFFIGLVCFSFILSLLAAYFPALVWIKPFWVWIEIIMQKGERVVTILKTLL